jgi:hypothetical protein
MLPYDGTPIKDELVRTGRLKGDVCNPDYDFLDPRLTDFYEGLTNMISLRGWIHGLEAVTVQLSTAWHEVAVMQRLFPKLPGMRQYKMKLSAITKRSNSLLLDVVEDLTYVYSDRREIKWKPEEVEASRQQVLDDLIAQRDEFVLANEELLLATLQREGVPIPTAAAASAVMPA